MNAQRSETEFVEGLRVYAPNENAPDYIIANLQIEGLELAAFCAARGNTVRAVIKRSKGGKYYAAVDTYKRETAPQAKPKPAPQPDQGGFVDDDLDSIPF